MFYCICDEINSARVRVRYFKLYDNYLEKQAFIVLCTQINKCIWLALNNQLIKINQMMSNIMQISMKAIISYTHLSWKLTAYGLKHRPTAQALKNMM